MPPKSAGLPLSELLIHAANELREVRRASAEASSHERPIMRFDECELELAVTFQAQGGGGVKFWVISAGAKVAASNVSRIRVKFTAPSDDAFAMQLETSGKADLPKPQ